MNAQARNEALMTFFKALVDRPLEPTEKIYVQELHKDAGGDPIEDLATQILWEEGGGAYLFTGQRGTGKSTELRRLKQRLEEQKCIVFLADMGDYLNETEPVEIGDFLILLMGALSDQVERRFGWDPARRTYWQRTLDFLRTEVKIEGIEAGIDGALLKLAIKDDPTFKERVQHGTRGHIARLAADARSFVGEVLMAVEKAAGSHQKIVLIVDSIERLRGIGADGARKVFDSAVNLFEGHSEKLRFPGLHIVYSVPPYLSALTGALSAYYGGRLYALASVHVFNRPAGGKRRAPSEKGLALMRDVIARRYPPWQKIFTGEALDRLAVYSGGDLREFMLRLVRNCLTRARSPSVVLPLQADDPVVLDTENGVRREMLPLADDDKAWLKTIALTHEAALPSRDKLFTLAGYFDQRLVLNYRNADDWYDVHPLLWEIIDAHGASGGQPD
jgi:hypothetical protein